MAAVFVLVTFRDGEIFTTLHPDRDNAYQTLDQYVREDWNEEALGDYEEFPPEEARDSFFEENGMSWVINEHVMEFGDSPDDVLLTPGMCEILRHAALGVNYQAAKKILEENGEIKNPEDADIEAIKVMENISKLLS